MSGPSPKPSRRFVVIPSFDQPDVTTQCVAALLAGAGHFIVLVVDHGTIAWTAPEALVGPRLEILRAGTDLWWTGATNVGIRHALEAGADLVMLLNADCVLEHETADHLFERASAGSGVTAPVQRSLTTGKVVSAGTLPLLSLGFPTLKERTDLGSPQHRRAIIRGGRGVVIRRDVLEQVGLPAEDQLPHYLADHDFFLRCLRHGFALEVADDLAVMVDDTSTSQAHRPEDLSWAEFKASLSAPRSHRNLRTVRAFFRRNYPIRRFHLIGTTLFVIRYTLTWALRRLVAKVGGGSE